MLLCGLQIKSTESYDRSLLTCLQIKLEYFLRENPEPQNLETNSQEVSIGRETFEFFECNEEDDKMVGAPGSEHHPWGLQRSATWSNTPRVFNLALHYFHASQCFCARLAVDECLAGNETFFFFRHDASIQRRCHHIDQ